MLARTKRGVCVVESANNFLFVVFRNSADEENLDIVLHRVYLGVIQSR